MRRKKAVVLASDFAGCASALLLHTAAPRPVEHQPESTRRLGGNDEMDEDYVGGLLLFGGCQNRTLIGHPLVPPGYSVRITAAKHDSTILEFPIGDTIRIAANRIRDQLRDLFERPFDAATQPTRRLSRS